METSSRIILLLLLLTIRESIQKSDPTSLTYRAAVVELHGIEYTDDAEKTLNDNADKIVNFIAQAAEKEADIVVFPEMSLTSIIVGNRSGLVSRSTLVPDPSQNYAPCTDSGIPVDEAFKRVACAAEQNDIYVVVNLLEKELCSTENCFSDGISVFITSVVFDRKGRVIAKSRKFHLVNEYDVLNVMQTPELSTFDTDFGVKFGIIICFDIMFEDTMVGLTRKLNVTDIVHSSGWFSSMPLLTTIQMVAGWAFAEDINLLSSGYNDVGWGTSGSGIYAGREGVVIAILPIKYHEELLVADVRKKLAMTAQHDDEHQLRLTNTQRDGNPHDIGDPENFKWEYDTYDDYETKIVAEDGLTVERLSHKGINCEFQVNITNLEPSGVTYRLLAFDGGRKISNSLVIGERTCTIVLCANNTVDSCGHIWHSSVVFNSIKVTATYIDNAKTILMPNTLGSDFMPFKNFTWNQHSENEHVHTSISLTKPTRNLLTFGLWGRNFEEDKRSLA